MSTESDPIPSAVRKFVLDYIDSIEMLQVLILLYENQKRAWTTHEITLELRSADTAIERRLADLYLRKILIRCEGELKHQYLPASEEMGSIIASLVDCHHVRPYRIIDLIYSRPAEALRAFADAFRLSKKED